MIGFYPGQVRSNLAQETKQTQNGSRWEWENEVSGFGSSFLFEEGSWYDIRCLDQTHSRDLAIFNSVLLVKLRTWHEICFLLPCKIPYATIKLYIFLQQKLHKKKVQLLQWLWDPNVPSSTSTSWRSCWLTATSSLGTARTRQRCQTRKIVRYQVEWSEIGSETRIKTLLWHGKNLLRAKL